MLAKLTSLVSAKALAGVAIAAASLGGGGALLATSNTPPSSPPGLQQSSLTSGSSSDSGTLPSLPVPKGSHGAAVVSAVASCMASASASATHGIGSCVSKVASSKGAAERSLHAGTVPNPHSTGH